MYSILTLCRLDTLKGWLVVLGLRPFETVFQSISDLEKEEEKKNNKREENVQRNSPAPTLSAAGPCTSVIQISRTPRHWKFYPAPSHHKGYFGKQCRLRSDAAKCGI